MRLKSLIARKLLEAKIVILKLHNSMILVCNDQIPVDIVHFKIKLVLSL